ncbi:MAG: hypothetical protein BWY70_00804 [Bacteroidetes bacterium ADurb.Bin408]|nr:MAG: hypothetical protein BWY70_00804 [Bacteroidetes bacterium ADurb.Bin408]
MSTLLTKSEQGIIVFHFFKSLKYPIRLTLSLLLIIVGLAMQFFMFRLFPGLLLVFAGNLLLLVKGYDNRLKLGRYDHNAQWKNISREQVDKLEQMHKKIKSWDKSLLDITNTLGFWMFVIIVIIITYLFVNGNNTYNKSYYILAFDIIALILPHWFTGVRKILTLPELIMKINTFKSMLKLFQGKMASCQVDFFVQLIEGEKRKEKKKNIPLPNDIKLKITPKYPPENFLGIYAQISINDVSGTKYPYFYTVFVAKPEYKLHQRTSFYKPTAGLIKKYTTQKEVDVLIIRQFTTRTSGYHTSVKAINKIMTDTLTVLDKLIK